ncbi:MAG TPA: NrtA/SsuA/CpmA family ABC transporter substrate-binding protein [Phycisphaerae bacterium]|nr:NrtA/SsuA/CpmA family ABC transporter substrate-binding protein [Phycisphaerae bacterium]
MRTLPRPIWLGLLAACGILAVLVIVARRLPQPRPESNPPDLSEHPIYSRYDLAAGDAIIHFGTQPLWAFAGNVNQAMARDLILREELGNLGMEIRFHSFLTGADINYFVERGDVDGGICADMALLRVAGRLPMVVPAMVDQGYDEIVARRALRMEQLKGRRIGVPLGTSTHHTLLEGLKLHGLSEAQVTVVPMDATEMAEALAEKRIDACGIWEPLTTALLARCPGSAVIHRGRYLGFVCFTKSFADRHPEAVRLILAAQVRAVAWMLRDRENVHRSTRWTAEACQALTPAMPFPYEAKHLTEMVIHASAISRIPVIPSSAMADEGQLARELEFLRALGHLPDGVEWPAIRAMFDSAILLQIFADSGRYRLDEFRYEGRDTP